MSILTHPQHPLQKQKTLVFDHYIIFKFFRDYYFILLDAVQGFHWVNSLTTIHSSVAYIKNENLEVKPFSYNSKLYCWQYSNTLCLIESDAYIANQSIPTHQEWKVFHNQTNAHRNNNLCYYWDDYGCLPNGIFCI